MKSKKRKDLNIINKNEKVRSKNNSNWMDVLRLAFKYAPNEARSLVKKINSHDKKIASLLKQLGNR